MRLETEAGAPVESPTEDQIQQALEGLGRQAGTFAILTRREEPLEYMQTSGDGDSFMVEFHEAGKHFRAANEAMTFEDTLALVTSYDRGDDAWRTLAPWLDVTKEVSGARWPVVAAIGVVTAGLVALVLYYSFK
jgi:hypothetical protein